MSPTNSLRWGRGKEVGGRLIYGEGRFNGSGKFPLWSRDQRVFLREKGRHNRSQEDKDYVER